MGNEVWISIIETYPNVLCATRRLDSAKVLVSLLSYCAEIHNMIIISGEPPLLQVKINDVSFSVKQ